MNFKDVILRIKPPPHSWVLELLKYYPVKVEILDCKPVKGSQDKVNEVFELKCKTQYIKEIIEKLRSSKEIDNLDIFTVDQRIGTIYGALRTKHCSVCRLFSDSSECFLGSAIYDIEDKYVKWRLIAHVDILNELITKLQENNIEIKIESISNVHDSEENLTLTLTQEKSLKIALKLGFFDYPRKVTLRELSKIMNISPSTLTEIMRNALRKVLLKYVKEESENTHKD